MQPQPSRPLAPQGLKPQPTNYTLDNKRDFYNRVFPIIFLFRNWITVNFTSITMSNVIVMNYNQGFGKTFTNLLWSDHIMIFNYLLLQPISSFKLYEWEFAKLFHIVIFIYLFKLEWWERIVHLMKWFSFKGYIGHSLRDWLCCTPFSMVSFLY